MRIEAEYISHRSTVRGNSTGGAGGGLPITTRRRLRTTRFTSFISPAATSHWNVSQRAASSPVPSAGLTKVSRLRETIVVEIAELSVR